MTALHASRITLMLGEPRVFTRASGGGDAEVFRRLNSVFDLLEPFGDEVVEDLNEREHLPHATSLDPLPCSGLWGTSWARCSPSVERFEHSPDQRLPRQGGSCPRWGWPWRPSQGMSQAGGRQLILKPRTQPRFDAPEKLWVKGEGHAASPRKRGLAYVFWRRFAVEGHQVGPNRAVHPDEPSDLEVGQGLGEE